MSTQTVVDVIVSGSTTTVVDKRVDGVTTVAGEAPVTNVSGQVPDLGVNTDILATQGDILSLTNDVASLRANLIVTGTTLTDEIGVLSGVLISTGNQLNFTINNLSGDLIATGNSLDSLRDILSGNLLDTGQNLQNQISSNDVDIARLEDSTGDLQLNKFDKIGGTISGNILPDVSGSLSIGSPEFPFSGGFFKDITVSNNTLFIGDVPIHSSNGGIDFLSATGETFFRDVTIRNLKVTGSETIIDVEHLAVKDNTITLNTGETGAGISLITGGLIIDRGSLTDADILFNEENDRFEFNFPVAIQGSPVITQGVTGSFVTQAKLTETGNTLESQVNIVDDRVDSVVSNLGNTGITLTSSIDSLSGTTNQSFLSTGSVVDSISGNLISTGANLQTQVNNISTNVGTTGQTLQSQITSNLNNLQSVETNLITTGQTLTNKINSDVSTVSSNLATTGQTLTADILTVSGEINQPFDELSGNLVITGQTLQTQITANDTGILENHNNINSTGELLLTNINAVSSNLVSTGLIVDDVSGNLITTGQSLQADIAIVSGIATGGSAQDFRELSGNLITTGQTLQSQITSNDDDISDLSGNLSATGQTLTSLLVQTGNFVDILSGNLITTGNLIDSEIAVVSGLVVQNDGDISTLQTATGTLKSLIDTDSTNLISTGNFLNNEIATVSGIAGGQDLTNLSGKVDILSGNLITTGQTLASDIAIVSGLTTGSSSDPALSGKVDTLSGNLITTGQTLQTQITSNDSDISTLTSNLGVTGQTLQTQITSNDSDISTITSNLATTGQTLQTQITSNDSDISTLTSNLVTTGQTLTSEIAIVSGIAENASDEALSGKVDTLSGNLITTGQTLQTQITSNDSDITSLTSNLVSTGQTLTTDITTVSGLIVDNDGDITALKTATGVLKTSTDSNTANLITTGQTLQTQITSNDGDISTLTTNLGTTGQNLQTQITSNDSDITTLTSNLITTGQTLTTDITTVSGLITDNDADITALKSATGVLKTSTDANTTNLITTGQTLQTQITSNDSDISTLTTNLGTTGQTLQTQITSNDSEITSLTSNLITTGQTLTTDINTVSGLITDNDADITALKTATGVLKTSSDNNTANLITTGQTLQTQITSNDGDITTLTSNLATTGQTLQTQITSNDGDITTLTSNLVTTGQTLTTNINTVATNLGTSGQTLQTQITSNDSDISTLTSNLGTTGQTLQTQITSNDSDIASLTTNLGTTGQTLQTQITSNDSDISTLDSTTVKLTTNQSIAGNKIFTNDVTINNLTVTGTEVVVDVENLAVKDNIIEINSGESSAGISRISGGIVIDRGTATNANILYNDANDRFELNFPLAVEGEVVASASNLITTGQTLTTNINTVSTNLGTSGQTLQTQITSNDSDISTLTTNLGTTGQTLQTQITSNDSDISTLTTNLGTTGQTLQTQITSNDSDISTLTTNLGTTGQTLQTQITSNDSDISTLTSNLVTTGQTLTTNINTVSTNLGTSGQTLQTQITSNDTDITNLSSNLVTTGQTLTTNINTVATNLVTTGQTLTSDIATVSGLIPATVIDGGGTANKVPLWSDANTIGDSVISQSSSKIGIGTASPSNILHVKHADPAIRLEDSSPDGLYGLLDAGGGDFIISADGGAGSANSFISFRVDGTAVGSEKMRITSAGKVGIGTNAPSEKLHIVNSSDPTVRITNTDGGTNDTAAFELGVSTNTAIASTRIEALRQSDGSVDLNFRGAGTTSVAQTSAQMTLDGVSGAVGINTTSPNVSSKLHVYGWTIIQSATNFASLRLQSTTGSWDIDNNNGTFGLQWAGGDKFNITSAGSVGIGINAPDQTLHVNSAGLNFVAKFESTDDKASILIEDDDTLNYIHSQNGYLSLGGQNSLSASNLNINSTNGSVGIGTETPGYKLDVNGTAHIATAQDSVAPLTLKSTYNGSTAGPLLDLYRKSGTPADGDNLGTITFTADTNVGSINEFARIESTALDVTDTTEDGALKLAVVTAGTLRSRVYMDSTETVFNDASQDFDFRVESDNSVNALFVQGSSGNVGIGTGNPPHKLSIYGTGAGKATVQIEGEGGADPYINFLVNNTTHWAVGADDSASDSFKISQHSALGTNDRITVLSGGSVGIGTNAPSEMLHINKSSGTGSFIRFQDTGGGGVYIGARSNVMELYAGGAERMRIASDGNVGVGETSPDVQLHVKSSSSTFAQVRVEAAADGHDSSVAYSQAGSIKGISGYDDSTNTVAIKYGTFGGSGIDINSSGNVGIGTNSPAHKLEVYGGGGGTFGAITNRQSANANTDGIATVSYDSGNQSLRLWVDANGHRYLNAGTTAVISFTTTAVNIRKATTFSSGRATFSGTAGADGVVLAGGESTSLSSRLFFDNGTAGQAVTILNNSGGMEFRTAGTPGSSSGVVKMTLSSAGNLGVGATSPSNKLVVINSDTDATPTALLQNSSTGDASLHFNVSGRSYTIGIDNSDGDKFKISRNNGLGTTDRLTINGDGNVGIGTNAPAKPLHIKGTNTAGIVIENTTNATNMDIDWYNNVGSVAGRIRYSEGTGDFTFMPNQSTAAVMFKYDGKVGIGVADPDQSLEVAGAIKSTGAYGFYAGRGDTTWASFGSGVPTILLRGSLDNSRAGVVQFKEYDGTDTAAIYSTDGSDGYGLVMAAYQGDMKFATGSLQGYKMVILGGGSVGIGTASPDNFVHIKEGGLAGRPASNSNTSLTIEHHNNTGIQFFSGTQTQIRFGDASNTAAGAIIYKHDDDNFKLNFTDHLTINGSGGEKVRVKNDGNVGIGVSPSTRLHVSYPAVGQSGSAVTSITKTQATNLGVKLSFTGGANSTNNIIGGISLGNGGEEYAGLYAIDGGSSAATDLAFFVGDTNGINEAVHIDSGGTVQINSPASSGTRSLTVKLTDNTSGAAVFEQSSNEYLRINTTNGSEKIILGDNGTNPKINFNGEYDFPTADGSAGQVLTTDGSGTLSFSSAGSGTVSGSGTDNYIPRWNGTTALENSAIYDNGSSRISLGTVNTSPWQALHVQSTGSQFSDGASGNNNYNVVVLDQNAYTSNYGGGILFGGKYNNAGNITTLAMVSASKVNGDGNFGGKVHIGGREHGTSNIAKVLTVTHDNVGIGTVTPAALLHVDGQAIIDALHFDSLSSHFIKNDGNLLRIAGDNGVKFQSYDGGWQTRMTIVDDGNVGIGTISPDNPLEVFGADSGIKISSASNNRPHLRLECGTAEKLRLSANTVYGAIGDSSDTNRYMAFKDGNIGIATVTPGVKLHVAGQGLFANNGANIILANSWSSGNTDVLFGGSGVSTGSAGNTAARIRCLATAPGGAATGSLTFTVNSGDTFVDALYIKENGNVGIGTNAPVKKLDVRAAASWDGIHIGSTAGSATAIDFARSTTHANPTARIGVAEPAATHTSDMRFFTSDASGGAPNLVEKMRINQNGIVIINDTATTNNNNARLYVNGPVYGSEFDLPSGGVIDWSNGDARIVEGLTSNYSLSLQNYDGSSAMVTTMFLKSGGNVGIGTNNPLSRFNVLGAQGNWRVDPDSVSNEIQVLSSTVANDGFRTFRLRTNETIIDTGGSESLRVDSGGNLILSKSGGAYVQLKDSSQVRGSINVENGSDGLVFTTGSSFTERMRIKSDGNVGIGHGSPNAKLSIKGDTEFLDENTGVRIGLLYDNGTEGILDLRDNNVTKVNLRTAGDSYFTGGNVGIGTNAPLDKLDVYGTGAIFRNLSDNADSVQIVRGTNHTANPDAKFYIYDNSSADWAAKINLDGASYGLDIQNGSDYFLLCRKVGGDRILEVHGSSTVVNDSGIDYDFRVESNNDDYLLYTDGGNDRVAISTNTPAAKLHVEGDFKVGTTNNGNWMGYKDVSLNGNTYTTALTINLNNHTGCYVKLFLSGDWSSHSAVAFVGEYFIQNGSDGYAEPGTVISEFDNTNTDSIESKIVDPSSDTFTIQLKLSTAANGTLGGKLSYHVMGMATAVS